MDRRQIVICDRDTDVLQQLTQTLQRITSAEVVPIHSGYEVLNYMRSAACTPILLILDHLLPDIKGMDVIQLVRVKEKFRELPILLMSGSNDDIDAGSDVPVAEHLLRKPIQVAELEGKVAALLGEKGSPKGEQMLRRKGMH